MPPRCHTSATAGMFVSHIPTQSSTSGPFPSASSNTNTQKRMKQIESIRNRIIQREKEADKRMLHLAMQREKARKEKEQIESRHENFAGANESDMEVNSSDSDLSDNEALSSVIERKINDMPRQQYHSDDSDSEDADEKDRALEAYIYGNDEDDYDSDDGFIVHD